MWWEPAFAFYWGILIKYINPALLYFIVVGIVKTDVTKPYEKYASHWQAIGFFIPIFGIFLFIISLFIWKDNQDMDYSEFDLYEDMSPEQLKNRIMPEEEVA